MTDVQTEAGVTDAQEEGAVSGVAVDEQLPQDSLTPAPMLESNVIVSRMAAAQGLSIFEEARKKLFNTQYDCTIVMNSIVGGTPADPQKLMGWIKSKFPDATADARIMEDIQQMAVAIAAETGVVPDREEAVERVVDKHLNVFKRDRDTGELLIEGRQVKAMLKEGINIRWPKTKWGVSGKGARSWFTEHCFVLDDTISLGVTEPTRVQERFVHTWRGNGISRDEVVEGAQLSFTLAIDQPDVIKDDDWAALWVTAESNGLGAVRSQGFGTFAVIKWDRRKVK